MIERTLSIIKPDAVAKNAIGEIIARFEKARLKVVGLSMQTLTKEDAKQFYRIHREQPFFESLVTFMSSGPSVALTLAAAILNRLNKATLIAALLHDTKKSLTLL